MRLLRLDTLLVADDLTATSEAALRTGAALRDAAGAALHVVHAAPPGVGMTALAGIRAEFLESIKASTARAGIGSTYTPHVLTEPVAESITTLADGISADVIITGQRARSSIRMDRPLGGTAFAIVTRSLIPCLAVSNPVTLPLRRVLVALDYSPASRGALLVAVSWASALRERSGSPPALTALHVHSEDGAEAAAHWKREVEHELGVLQGSGGDWAGVNVEGMTVRGEHPVDAIVEASNRMGADLVVLGTRNPDSHGAHHLGSVSAAVLGQSRTPVLLVPPAVWRDYAKDMD
jgi:nucleotide-binding universal stress UspA family protein